ncbi:hypothetical protein CCR96_11690 [Halochromatium roseum]|nr:hypothetical protein [Halochromatium roseum]
MPLMPKRAQTASPAEQPSTDAAAVATSATAPPASSASVAPPPGSAALAAASPAAATANQAEPSAKSRPKLSNLARIRRIEQTIESIRPNLQRDHGDIELIDVDGKNIFVKMVGACSGCQLAAVTLEGIQERICEDLGELVRVLPEQAMAVAQRA